MPATSPWRPPASSCAAIVSVSGSGARYTVTVDTGGGPGTLRLDLVDDDSIRDAAGNPLATTTWTFTTGA